MVGMHVGSWVSTHPGPRRVGRGFFFGFAGRRAGLRAGFRAGFFFFFFAAMSATPSSLLQSEVRASP